MNKLLLETICRHVYEGFLLITSNYVDPNYSKALLSKEFLLNKSLKFDYNDGVLQQSEFKNVWGCQMRAHNNTIKVLCGDCSVDSNKEYALIIHHEGSPIYGVYSAFNKDLLIDQEASIAVSTDGEGWLECNTFLQATFLAGVEQIKELGLGWGKCEDYIKDFNALKSFIYYHDGLLEKQNEVW
jgi:hypothetical protein